MWQCRILEDWCRASLDWIAGGAQIAIVSSLYPAADKGLHSGAEALQGMADGLSGRSAALTTRSGDEKAG